MARAEPSLPAMSKPLSWSCLAVCALAMQACGANDVASIPPVAPVVTPTPQREELYEELMEESPPSATEGESGDEEKPEGKTDAKGKPEPKGESGDKPADAAPAKPKPAPAGAAPAKPAAQPAAKPAPPKEGVGNPKIPAPGP